MTPPLATIKKRAEFVQAAKAGKKWVSTGLIIQAIPNGTEDQIAFGLTITKKTYKQAVKRNRIRRRMRALAHEFLPDHAAPGYNYIFIGRTETLSKAYPDLRKDLKWCLKRMELLQEAP